MSSTTEPLRELSRADLCTLGRELMLAAHLQDRAGIPTILRRHPPAEAFDLAIEEWATASPVYTRRMQRLLHFAGDGVDTIFKALQLDVGFPHQFLDVGYQLQDRRGGEFWLRSCGALADVVPMGESFVQGMCHDIEDPTFDATAVATNPQARVRPVHRPPGVPTGGPDCHWVVRIDDDADPAAPHPWLEAMAGCVAAGLPNAVDTDTGTGDGGWDDYRMPFDPHFELEHLSQRALLATVRELAIQGHLLARAMMAAVERRYGPEEASEVGRAIFTGIGWIAAERLTRALDVDAASPDALARVLPLTHLLLPVDYVGLTVDAAAGGTTTIRLSGAATGLSEADPWSLPGLLAQGADEIVEALVHGVDPGATVTAVEAPASARAWEVVRSSGATPSPAREPGAVSLVRFSTGVEVTLRRRVPRPPDAAR